MQLITPTMKRFAYAIFYLDSLGSVHITSLESQLANPILYIFYISGFFISSVLS